VAGKVAIVTGAASAAGIGFATARALAREGANVVLTDIEVAAVRARADELLAAGLRAIWLTHDVSCEESWIQVVKSTLDSFGRLDILVNNAGITIRNPVEAVTLGDWNRQLSVNLTGPFLGCKHSMPAMRAQPTGGSIVNVASISGLTGFRNSAAYGSSKAGLRQLSKVVAIEGAKSGIRCNCVYPGMIVSDIHKNIVRDSPDQHQAIVASIPLGRMGEPDDIANYIVFLASDEAKYVTGAECVIDGGLMAAG